MSIIERLRQFIIEWPLKNRVFYVAYSGGVDSHVLLHALNGLRQEFDFELKALHVRHDLQMEAPAWVEFCESTCAEMEVELITAKAEIGSKETGNIEERARDERYKRFVEMLPPDCVLLTAHHSDDQAETVLLRLLRGTGVDGLAGMSQCRELGEGWLARPLLLITREQIVEYAHLNQLQWLDDPSNHDSHFDRNYLRAHVLPVLKTRWPSLSYKLNELVSNCQDNRVVVDQAVGDKLQELLTEYNGLNITGLLEQKPAFQRYILRYWLKRLGMRAPSRRFILTIQNEMLTTDQDAQPRLAFGDYELRRFDGELLLLHQQDLACQTAQYIWSMQKPLAMAHGELRLKTAVSQGLRAPKPTETVTVCFRQGGERCRLANESFTRSLKKLLQMWRVPSWQRQRIPLIYYNNELAAIVGYAVCEPFVAENGYWPYMIHKPCLH